jgi:hypothetical protein
MLHQSYFTAVWRFWQNVSILKFTIYQMASLHKYLRIISNQPAVPLKAFSPRVFSYLRHFHPPPPPPN